MIYLIKTKQIAKVLPLFKGLNFSVAVNAILEGNRPGEIYVDDLENPRSAFVLATQGPECYLVGFPNNDRFNYSVQRLIIERITPEVTRHGFSVLRFYPQLWEKKIGVILKTQRVWKRHYLWYNNVTRLRTNWKENIPIGFYLMCVDENLLKRVDLKNLDHVISIINNWKSIDVFMSKGYGVCLIHENTIVSWCLLNKRAGNKCEIVIETAEEYRNSGLATLLGAALLEYCFSKNLEPSWHCARDNLASTVVAEKIGFKKTLVYSIYCWYPRWIPYLVWTFKKQPSAFIPKIIRILRNRLYGILKITIKV